MNENDETPLEIFMGEWCRFCAVIAVIAALCLAIAILGPEASQHVSQWTK